MSHEASPKPIIGKDGSVNQELFKERGLKLNLEQPISHQMGGRRFEGTARDMFVSCPYIVEMVNLANQNGGGIDAAIGALKLVGMTAGVELIAPLESIGNEVKEVNPTTAVVKKNQIFPNPPML